MIVTSIKGLSKTLGVAAFGISAILLAISTSLPELVVSVMASIENDTSLILGNILGSNIADLSLVIGGVAIVSGSLKVTGEIVNRDIYLAGAAGLLPLLLIADGTISKADGVVLLVVYFIMISTFLRTHAKSVASHILSASSVKRMFVMMSRSKYNNGVFWRFVVGVATLLASSHFIVRVATDLATSTGLSGLVIGLFLVGVGTSLPELAFEIKAARTKNTIMAFGDLLGSVVANSTLILGLAAVIRPITLQSNGLLPYGRAIAAFAIIYFLFVYFVRSKKKLVWWEGFILLGCYFLFMLIELMKA